MSHRPPIPPHYPTITKRPITLPFPPPHIQYAVTDQSRGDQNDGWRLTCGLSEARMETHKSHDLSGNQKLFQFLSRFLPHVLSHTTQVSTTWDGRVLVISVELKITIYKNIVQIIKTIIIIYSNTQIHLLKGLVTSGELSGHWSGPVLLTAPHQERNQHYSSEPACPLSPTLHLVLATTKPPFFRCWVSVALASTRGPPLRGWCTQISFSIQQKSTLIKYTLYIYSCLHNFC